MPSSSTPSAPVLLGSRSRWFGQTAVLPGFSNASANSELTAIVSGDREKRVVVTRSRPGRGPGDDVYLRGHDPHRRCWQVHVQLRG